jgi:putative glutamine amidotransferase
MSKYVLEITPQNVGHVFASFGELTKDIDYLFLNEVKLMVFTGGADVCPLYYKDFVGKYTHYNLERDAYEKVMFDLALSKNIPMVGICRGAQFLCAMAGGRLVQDITNHGGHHKMRTFDNRVFQVNSTHHQMQLPPPDAKVLGWSEDKLSDHYWDGKNNNIPNVEKEYEVVYYPKIRAVGIQYHPEWLDRETPAVEFAVECVQNSLFG